MFSAALTPRRSRRAPSSRAPRPTRAGGSRTPPASSRAARGSRTLHLVPRACAPVPPSARSWLPRGADPSRLKSVPPFRTGHRDRKSVVSGKRVDLGGRRIIKKKEKKELSKRLARRLSTDRLLNLDRTTIV